MFGLGMTELIVILVIILIVFGAKRLPEIGAGLGKGIKNFRGSIKELSNSDSPSANNQVASEEKKDNVNS